MIVYVVEMLRHGKDETHHYILGAYNDLTEATYAGDVEVSWRGGKYTPRILRLDTNEKIAQEKLDYHGECK